MKTHKKGKRRRRSSNENTQKKEKDVEGKEVPMKTHRKRKKTSKVKKFQ